MWFAAAGQNGTLVFNTLEGKCNLPDSYYIIQDRQGVMWISTFYGLYTYDGSSCRRQQLGLTDEVTINSNLKTLIEDSEGRIWVGTDGEGIIVSDRARQHYRLLPAMKKTSVTYMAQDQDGMIWVNTSEGLVILEEVSSGDSTVFRRKDLTGYPADLQQIHARMIYVAGEGIIWLGTDSGIYRYDKRNNRLIQPEQKDGWINLPVDDIEQDRDSILWVTVKSTGARLFEYNSKENKFHPYTDISFQQPGSKLRMCFDTDNRIWLSEFGYGMQVYDFERECHFLNSFQNSNIRYMRFIRDPYADQMGNIWVCSDGVFQYPYWKGFQSYLHPYAFDQSCSAIFETDGKVLLAYREGGVIFKDENGNETGLYNHNGGKGLLTSELIFGIEELSKDKYLLSGYNTLQVLNVNDQSLREYPLGGVSRGLLKDSQGKVWIGSVSGLYSFNEKDGPVKILQEGVSEEENLRHFNALIEGTEGNLWLSSILSGIVKYTRDENKFTSYKPKGEEDSSWRGNDICNCAGYIWLASETGIARLDRTSGEIRLFNETAGLNSSYISAVVCIDDREIWASTYDGVTSLNIKTEKVNNYNQTDGLINNFFYPGVKWVSKEGVIYFPGRSGLDFFNPDDLRSNPYPPGIIFTNVKKKHKKGEEQNFTPGFENVKLSNSDLFLEINYNGVHYQSNEALEYFYRLRTNDPWIAAGQQRSILFSGLQAGEYQFQVKARSPDGLESPSSETLNIVVLPPFWQTWWFRILVVILLSSAIYYWVKRRENAMKLKEDQRLKVQRKMADLEKRALLAQMNPHFIFNAMNSIQQFIFNGDSEGAMRYLTRFSRLVRHVLNYSALPAVPLADEVQLIKDYIELELMRFPKKFEYSIRVDRSLDVNSVEVPPFFIQPQIENAILHGLMHKEENGKLDIAFEKQNGHLKIIVEDNGIGRDASRDIPDRNRFKGNGKGLVIARERLRFLHADQEFEAIQIIDLMDPKNRPAGTRVEVIIPLEED